MRFHGNQRKTNPIHGSLSHNCCKWWRFQAILLMMAKFHGELRKTNPISKSLSHIYSMKAGNLSDIDNNSMRPKWCLQHDGRKFTWYLWWWQDAQPQRSMAIKARLTKTTEDLSNNYGDGGTLCNGRRLCIKIVWPYVTILFNHTNPFTFFAVNDDYNDNHSGGKAGGKQFIYK